MYLKLAFLSLWRRPLRQGIVLVLIALATALPVFLLQMTGGLYRGINRAVEPFPVLAGAKGSAYQLVLNTVFLKDRPLENISYETVDKLRKSGKAKAVYPLAFGDNYRGFPIIGVEKEIFQYKPNRKKDPWLTVKTGKSFSEKREVVLGSEAARLSGLRIGDTFHSIHGMAAAGKNMERKIKSQEFWRPAAVLTMPPYLRISVTSGKPIISRRGNKKAMLLPY